MKILVELVELACDHSKILKTVTFLLVGVPNHWLLMALVFDEFRSALTLVVCDTCFCWLASGVL